MLIVALPSKVMMMIERPLTTARRLRSVASSGQETYLPGGGPRLPEIIARILPFYLFIALFQPSSTVPTDDGRVAIMSTFLYFAYGSNLLAQRLHINNPSAVRVAPGKLNGFRLDFNTPSKYWDGSPSTVVPDEQENVWGAIWAIDVIHMDSLDKQEGVNIGKYFSFNATVVKPDGETVVCRSYQLVDQPDKRHPLPLDRRPSKAYLETILLGAYESNLPSDYLEALKRIPDNGRDGPKMPWTKRQ